MARYVASDSVRRTPTRIVLHVPVEMVPWAAVVYLAYVWDDG